MVNLLLRVETPSCSRSLLYHTLLLLHHYRTQQVSAECDSFVLPPVIFSWPTHLLQKGSLRYHYVASDHYWDIVGDRIVRRMVAINSTSSRVQTGLRSLWLVDQYYVPMAIQSTTANVLMSYHFLRSFVVSFFSDA